MSGQSGESGKDDKEQKSRLEDAEEIHDPQAPLERETMDEQRKSDDAQADSARVPSVALLASCSEEVLSYDDGISSAPSEQDGIGCEHADGEEAWFAVCEFEVALLASVLG